MAEGGRLEVEDGEVRVPLSPARSGVSCCVNESGEEGGEKGCFACDTMVCVSMKNTGNADGVGSYPLNLANVSIHVVTG